MDRVMGKKEGNAWENIHYVKLVSIGSIDPGMPLPEQTRRRRRLC